MADVSDQAVGSVQQTLHYAASLLNERPDLALEQAEEILRVVPNFGPAMMIAGGACRRLGRLTEARQWLEAVAKAEPKSATTALELGQTARAQGDFALAIAELERAVAIKPKYPEAWVALADAHRESGNEEGADRAYLCSVNAATSDPLVARAALAMVDGKLEIAEPLLRQKLKAQPTDVAAIRLLGELALRLGREEDGIALLRRAVELAPSFDKARELLARTLGRGNRVLEALADTEILIAHDPENMSHRMFQASLLVRIGKTEEARAVYEYVLARAHKQPKIWMGLGHVLKTLGQQADAVNAYRKAVELEPTLGEAWWSLANLKTVKFTDADVKAMHTALSRAKVKEDLLHLQFALGKAFEDAGEDKRAFDHYSKGNTLRRSDLSYSAEELREQCKRTAALFTRAFLAERAGAGSPTPDPIFIVGLPRSGSTLIEQILSSHSQVEGTMELPDLMSIAARLRKKGGGRYPELLADLKPEELRALGEEYIERTRIIRHTDRPFFIDKMPNNWQHAGLIQLILPNAKIIDARRHPIGCCFSAWKQHFARGQGFSYDLKEVGDYYRNYVALMESFDKAAPGRIHRVIYERMVADTESEVRRLLAYAGLDFEDSCLAFWRNDRAVRTASSEQVRQPIFTDAVEHWRRFEPWLSPLIEALGPVVDAYPEAP